MGGKLTCFEGHCLSGHCSGSFTNHCACGDACSHCLERREVGEVKQPVGGPGSLNSCAAISKGDVEGVVSDDTIGHGGRTPTNGDVVRTVSCDPKGDWSTTRNWKGGNGR